MSFTPVFHLAMPPFQTVRYDLDLNINFSIIEAALLGFPSAYPPGSTENYPEVIPTMGMRWMDTGTSTLKTYINGTWV